MEHKLENNTLYVERGGVVAYCSCGWNSGKRFSGMIASVLFREHQEEMEKQENAKSR